MNCTVHRTIYWDCKSDISDVLDLYSKLSYSGWKWYFSPCSLFCVVTAATRSLVHTFCMEMLWYSVLLLLLVLLLSWALRIILYFMLEQSTMRQEKGNFLYEKTSRSNVKLIGKIFCIFISLCLFFQSCGRLVGGECDQPYQRGWDRISCCY